MSELSIFIDESGDFGSNSENYLLTLVFHDQSNCIDAEIQALAHRVQELGLPSDRALHAGPIVRKEDEYRSVPLSTRRAALSRLYAFTRRTGVSYITISVRKKECPDRIRLKARLARELAGFFRDNMAYFLSLSLIHI